MYEIAVYGFEFLIVFILNLFGVSADSTVVLSFIVLNFLFYFLQYIRSGNDKMYYLFIICAYLVRIAFIYIDLFTNLQFLPWSNYGTDCDEFYRQSLIVYLGGYSRHSFARFMGTLMKVFGISRFFWQFMFLTLSIVSLKVLYKILCILEVEEGIQRLLFFVSCIFPFVAGYSVVYLRESIVIFLSIFSVYFFIRWIDEVRIEHFILCNLISLLGAFFHAALVGFNISYIIIYAIFNKHDKQFNFSFSRLVVSLLLVLILYFLYDRYGHVLFRKLAGIESIEDTVIITVDGGSSYKQYVGNSSTVFNLIIYTPARLIFYLFSPFIPWKWRGINDIVSFLLDAIFYIVSIFLCFKHLFKSSNAKNDKINIARCLFIMALIVSFIFAWGTTNVGTAMRHRTNVVFILATILGLISTYGKPTKVREIKKIREIK